MQGNSGATFEFYDNLVVKSGGDSDLVTQHDLCLALGPEVAPEVFYFNRLNNLYAMERLADISDYSVSLLFLVFSKLLTQVWNRSAVMHAPEGWNNTIQLWIIDNAPWIAKWSALEKLYEYPTQEPVYCLTHGDPTLVNVMRRRDGSGIVLIDPAPPRTGIPSLREVDVGKLLQSVAGWGHAPLPVPPEQVVQAAWDAASGVPLGLWRARCYFWAAVHCARVVRHGTPSEAVRKWSREASEKYAVMCGDEIAAGF